MRRLLTGDDAKRLKDIYEPTVVGVQLEDSRKSICVMPDGEIRTYGYVNQSEIAGENVYYDPSAVRCYLSSRNCGLDWLYEKEHHEDFQTGLEHVTTHLFVKSYSGSYTNRGYAGHCAFNRTNGALLVPDPDFSGAEALQLCRVHDKRLLSEIQGAVWNFPAAHRGELTLKLRIIGEGINIRLCDYHMNAGDEHAGPLLAACIGFILPIVLSKLTLTVFMLFLLY